MASDSDLTIGVDLGGTKLLTALVAEGGEIVARDRRPTQSGDGFDAVVRQVADSVRACRERAGRDQGERVSAVGVGAAGQVSAETGTVRFAPNLEWRDAPIGAALEDALDLPVVVLNDVRAATWGEWRHGAGECSTDMVVVFVGTGVGGGVVSGGRLLDGCTNAAGELGHIPVVTNGRECTCGHRGCLEAYVGGWAIAERAQAAARTDPDRGRELVRRAGSVGEVTAETVHEASTDGDPLAVRLVDETAAYLASGMVGLVNAFSPCRLVLGGGIVEHAPLYVDRVRAHVLEFALGAAVEELEVVGTALGGDGGAIGAAVYARDRELDHDSVRGPSG